MIFNDRDFYSYWHVKAAKFDVSYFTDFERQELSDCGLVFSAIRVPTERIIKVTLVAKEKTTQMLDKLLHEVGDFLHSSGTAKLLSNRDSERYYVAECVSMSVPTFTGNMAKFEVMFACIDYRPYSVTTDKPIGDSLMRLSNFTFAGKHCLNDMGCLFMGNSRDLIPEINANKYSIAGRDGTLRYANRETLGEKTLSGCFFFVNQWHRNKIFTDEEMVEQAHTVAQWLISAGRSSLIFDNDILREYEADVAASQSFTTKDWQNGKLNIKLILQPTCKSIVTTAHTSTVTTEKETYKAVNISKVCQDGIGYKTPLKIAITLTSNTPLTEIRIRSYENGKSRVIRLAGNEFSLSKGKTLTIDTENFAVDINGENTIYAVRSGDFPTIDPQKTDIIKIYTNEAATMNVTVSANVRWL